MSGEELMFCYLGAVGSVVLLNAVQWGLSRDSIYGLFTLYTFPSLINAVIFSLDLTNLERNLIYDVTLTLMHIGYIALVDRLFDLAQQKPLLHRWFRIAQLLLIVFWLIDTGIDLSGADRHHNPVLWSMTVLFGLFFVGNCVISMWVAAQPRNLVGRFFLLGSLCVFLDETRAVVSFSGLIWEPPVGSPTAMANWLMILMEAVIIVDLLSFSLCLLFRQRQLAVAQAVAQTRVEEQLVHERNQRQRDSLEAELLHRKLEQEKTDVQLRALQAQVNPHFLFNSLNSLSALIDDDPDRAGQFVNELSIVYRYLLKANDEPLTTLASELDFIQSYYQLLKTRYGNGLNLAIQVRAEDQTGLIPPLTLQLLVENAVKHNVVSPKWPLKIIIFTDESGQLVVRNTLQPKQTRVLSNGVGLSTIATQLQRLQQPAPTISNQDGFFTVSVPLIKPPVLAEATTPA